MKHLIAACTNSALQAPRKWFAATAGICLALILLVLIPTLSPTLTPSLSPLRIDTDPENMLSAEEPVRIAHSELRAQFSLYDMIVVGVINETHPQGVFNSRSLTKISEVVDFAKALQWSSDDAEEKPVGVISKDLIAPSTVDNITQISAGTVGFELLMKTPPNTDEEALRIRDNAQRIPFLNGTLIADDGKSLALYLPLSSKSVSFRVAEELRAKIAELNEGVSTGDTFYITGLPVAQDQFGVEMFVQMAICAPMAMALMFFLMWLFFRNVRVILAPMIVAMVAVIITMCALITTGNTLHIMSSMIPIFIMPIAVLDAVHVLSDFFERYQPGLNRADTLTSVMDDLKLPMLFTSLTTSAGFLSLALAPIPPVQVFGIFVALGVMLAWVATVTLLPAYFMLLSDDTLAKFGNQFHHEGSHPSLLNRIVRAISSVAVLRPKVILASGVALLAISVVGISKITINDNPVKWFTESHPIRVADKALNETFAGTYMAYLALTAEDIDEEQLTAEFVEAQAPAVKSQLLPLLPATLQLLSERVQELASNSTAEGVDWWSVQDKLDTLLAKQQTFKQPEQLAMVEALQQHLQRAGLVGKSSGLPDIVKTVYRELVSGNPEDLRIPSSQAGVAQTLLTFESSHRPQDLWHFVTQDFRSTALWLQLPSGDNQAMNAVVESTREFFRLHPEWGRSITPQWFGLTYINTIWQDKMVAGMLEALIGSFLIVLVLMVLFFRSVVWGLLCMVPLTITIATIYGVLGLSGKYYDMPVAVLSSLSLGLAVDYSIHFIARSRALVDEHGSWKTALPHIFGEPAQAIGRNIIVIGVGFMPLILAPLIPYQTVGVLISAILLLAGAATLIVLPACITLLQETLFSSSQSKLGDLSHV